MYNKIKFGEERRQVVCPSHDSRPGLRKSFRTAEFKTYSLLLFGYVLDKSKDFFFAPPFRSKIFDNPLSVLVI